jgi:Vanadium chloroperoxidase N-terminal domain/PAP2 superfamily
MGWTTRNVPKVIVILAILLLLSLLTVSGPVGADEVQDWNIAGLDIAIAGGQNPIVHSRTLAMVHLAIHDALNAIDRRYEPYVYERRAEPNAAAGAAVAAAARDVLAGVVLMWGNAEQRAKAQAMLESTYTAALARVPDGLPKNHGIAVGQAAALAMLAARKNDQAMATVPYTPGSAPGKWRPTPNPVPAHPPIANPAMAPGNQPAVLPQWANVTPFTMAATWQFRLNGPPALSSAQYARDYDEVRRLGGKNSTERTAQQVEIAKFWYESSPVGWSRVARVVGTQRGLDPWDNARLLALVNTVIADGYIAGADTRYLYDFWRPVTAIRAGDTDGNDATVPDPAWESFMNTPALPDYPSTHSVAGGAASAVLARFFGADQVSFSMASGPPFAGITRAFTTFSGASQENADSRVYAGIHFRSACQDGIAQGEQIGRRAAAQYLQPYKK